MKNATLDSLRAFALTEKHFRLVTKEMLQNCAIAWNGSQGNYHFFYFNVTFIYDLLSKFIIRN